MVDTLRSARWAVEQGANYVQVVRTAVRLGNDTDTTACVAGGIAGIRYGLMGILPNTGVSNCAVKRWCKRCWIDCSSRLIDMSSPIEHTILR